MPFGWVKNAYYKNNFTHVVITSVNNGSRLELEYPIHHLICLFVKSLTIFVLFRYHKAMCVSLHCGKI